MSPDARTAVGQQVVEQIGRGGAAAGILAEGGGQQRAQPGLDQRVRQVGVVDDHAVEHGGRGALAEGRKARRGEVDDRGPAEDVGERQHLLAVDLLRRHPAGGADDEAGTRERGSVSRRRDTEVDDLQPARGAQHVGRLQIAVDQAHGMDRQQRLREAGGERVLAPAVERPVLRDEATRGRGRGRTH